jgi:hypothetical protein
MMVLRNKFSENLLDDEYSFFSKEKKALSQKTNNKGENK